ncbi:alpha/beta fold hydrolase [Kineosporia succinea]|uniref:Pimeloyl-ACP methyl ester carboxylesterase n=1 Tax=Kineosporia succinea TaxID=84632 RepID=A0ABT9PED1_9ACTN|nr:alpha/beta hydrolase [Kineosporia succinea]MDP9831070.1 pimeloyl-ACP methyl ester carboxylesterase [Kineosporia succinea]
MSAAESVDDSASRTAAAVLDVAPLLHALGTPQRVHLTGLPPTGRARQQAQELLSSVTGDDSLVVTPDAQGHSAAELIIGRRLNRAIPFPVGPVGPVDPAGPAGPAGVRAQRVPREVETSDGSVLRCYVSGPRTGRPVLLVGACGMPVGLVGGWVRHLSREHRVITWESRGLFGQLSDPGFDGRGQDLTAQAGDVLSVLSAFDLDDVHLAGLCGGAAIALEAAGHSARVRSVSLWHGDYELGGDAAKTPHQHDMQALLVQAGRSREKAGALQRLFRRPSTLAALRDDIAHHLYYPYATAELLYRYGRLNGAIMTTDCRPLLARVTQPTLVVTGPDDHTAHPDGSRYVSAHLRRARLVELAHHDHLAAFDAGPQILSLADDFLASDTPAAERSSR